LIGNIQSNLALHPGRDDGRCRRRRRGRSLLLDALVVVNHSSENLHHGTGVGA
jgi:hypothetical protein